MISITVPKSATETKPLLGGNGVREAFSSVAASSSSPSATTMTPEASNFATSYLANLRISTSKLETYDAAMIFLATRIAQIVCLN